MDWQHKALPAKPDYNAPDGSEIRELVRGDRSSMAHFRLPAGKTSKAVAHHTVEELWYVISGSGQMWLKPKSGQDSIIDLRPGVAVAIPAGTSFQFRTTGTETLDIVGVTSPPWPSEQEAYAVEGRWQSDAPRP